MSSTSFSSGICKLSRFALISTTGDDASAFLHSQLTNDINSLSKNHACLAGYCTPKGRLLTSLLVWKSGESDQEQIMLELPAELQESVQKRLQMFVLRSQVKFTLQSKIILGVLGNAIAAQLTEWFPELPNEPYAMMNTKAGHFIRLADVPGLARYQWIMTNDVFEQVWPTINSRFSVLPESTWLLSEIHAGIPHINLATQEKFVPQMINYELIGGVNFKKGCYPGQEIVARSHYLGKQKRRMALAHIEHPHVQNGAEVFSNDDETQPCGMVVNAQPSLRGGSDCLIEIKTACLHDAKVHLNSGEVCQWLPMPYPLPNEE